MAALADRVGALAGWRRAALAVLLGAVAATALPPYHLLPALIFGFAPLVWLIDSSRKPWQALRLGWFFGFGHFLVALHWVGYAFLVDAERFAPLMPFAVAGLAAGMALYPALAVLAAWLAAPPGWWRLVALAVAWSGAEWLRGRLFTGFPWDPIGLAWIVSDAMAQGYAYIGIIGLGLLTVLAAGAPAYLGRRRAVLPLAGLAALLLLGYGLGHLRLATAVAADVPEVRLRLVQASIPQQRKWRREYRLDNFRRYLQLSAGQGWDGLTHLIWPETATAFFLAEDGEARRLIAPLIPDGGLLLTGSARRRLTEPDRLQLWNSLLAIDHEGTVVARYDKHHLVPFGEYLPFRPLLARLGLAKLAVGSVDYSAGPGPALLRFDGLPPVQPLICYEAIFADEIARPRPAWLLNVTNDAWFGPAAGPAQHLALARLRALEQGVPLVRAANTGISAVVDPWGRVLSSLDVGVAGVLDSALPAALAEAPPYALIGELWLAPLALGLAVSLWRRRDRSGWSLRLLRRRAAYFSMHRNSGGKRGPSMCAAEVLRPAR